MTYEYHRLSMIFPLIEGEEFKKLVSDIRENGLDNPIMLFEEKILDGRNRFRACQAAGVKPRFGHLNDDRDPVAYVVSQNMHRRHLTTSQRAMIAAEIANMGEGGDHSVKLPSAISQGEAAKLMNVHPRSVGSAAVVRKKGTKEEIAAVKNGEKKVGNVAENIRKREKLKTDPEYQKQAKARNDKRHGPAREARILALSVKTIIMATQEIRQAAETLDALSSNIPDLGEKRDDVVQSLENSRTLISRFKRQLECGGHTNGLQPSVYSTQESIGYLAGEPKAVE